MNKLSSKPKNERLSVWITDKYIYVMLFLFPLFTGFEGYSKLTLSKYIFFVVFSSLWLLILLFDRIRMKQIAGFKLKDYISLFVLLYFFFCCLSSIFSPYKSLVLIGGGRFDGLFTIFLCICIFLGISKYSCPKPSYIYTVAASITFNCVIAVLQITGYNPLNLFPGDYTFYDAGIKFSSVFLGTIGNADLFSAFLCLGLPLLTVYYITSPKRPIFLLPSIALSAFCLFASGVSGGILAFAVCVVLALPFVITDIERLKKALEAALLLSVSVFLGVSLKIAETAENTYFDFSNMRTYFFVVLSVVLMILRPFSSTLKLKSRSISIMISVVSITAVILGFALIYLWKGNYGTIYEISQVLHGNAEDSFGSSRVLIWRETLKLVPEKLFLGGGPGTLPERLDLNFSRYVAETGKTLESSVDNAHNDYLGILVNTGLMSLIFYLGAQVISLAKAAKTSRLNAYSTCFACSLLCYWIQAFFGLGLFLVSPIMWLIWGLLASALHDKTANIPRMVKNDEPATDY